eukprot:GFUD01107640.1.p1 GENE.GFUD01107640.1~~GFUD01107640.1.p1  ORF type:complete len:114 (+),score=1.45 GFUD01107640.1:204-545(+)
MIHEFNTANGYNFENQNNQTRIYITINFCILSFQFEFHLGQKIELTYPKFWSTSALYYIRKKENLNSSSLKRLFCMHFYQAKAQSLRYYILGEKSPVLRSIVQTLEKLEFIDK